MAFPTTGVLDDFNRANAANLGANWTDDFEAGGLGGFDISGNAAIPEAAAQCQSYYNVADYGPDCEVYVTFSTKPNNAIFSHLYSRMAAAGTAGVDAYSIALRTEAGTDIVRLFRLDNAVHTQLGADISQEFASGDALGLEIVGTTLTAYHKPAAGSWTSLGTRTDATYSAAGKLAILHYNDGSGVWDDFGGGTVVANGAPFGARGTAFNGGKTFLGRIR